MAGSNFQIAETNILCNDLETQVETLLILPREKGQGSLNDKVNHFRLSRHTVARRFVPTN